MFWWKLSFGLKTAPPIIWFSAPGFFHRKSRLVRHERLCQVITNFDASTRFQTMYYTKHEGKKLSCTRPEIVESFLPLLLPNWSLSEKVSFWPKTQLSVFLGKICPSLFRRCIALNQFNWRMMIQLTGSIYWGSHKWKALNLNMTTDTYIKQAKLQELRCAGIFGIWWAPAVMPVIGVFLDENYRPPSHFHDWHTRASNLTKTLGRLNSGSKDRNLQHFAGQISDLGICRYYCEKSSYKNHGALRWITNKFKSAIEISYFRGKTVVKGFWIFATWAS